MTRPRSAGHATNNAAEGWPLRVAGEEVLVPTDARIQASDGEALRALTLAGAGRLKCNVARRGGPRSRGILQPKIALAISSATSEVAQPRVVGTDHTSIWCLAVLTPRMRLMTQK